MANKYFNRKKAGRPRKTTDSSIPEKTQDTIKRVLSDEFAVAYKNLEPKKDRFEKYNDMLHCVRKNKPNDWEPDIYLPEFVSRVITQIGNFVSQYFSSRDFVEPILENADEQDALEAKASKRLLNTMLNDKKAHYFQKVVRLLMFVFLGGYGIVKGGYRQRLENRSVGFETVTDYVRDQVTGDILGDDGMPFTDPALQTPQKVEYEEEVFEDVLVEDRPTFEVFPISAVYLSPEYTYSLQDKEYVIFESEMTIQELEELKDQHDYFNLHLLGKQNNETGEYREKTYDKKGEKDDNPDSLYDKVTVCERWGKWPIVVKDRDEAGKVADWEVGVDNDGAVKDNATFEECILTFVKPGYGSGVDQLIGFRPSPHTARPMVRFLCYVDPLDDDGFGDGELVYELQRAMNDMFNLSFFRETLATTPAFKGRKFTFPDPYVHISPERLIEVDGDPNELTELKVTSDMQGATMVHGLLSNRTDYAMATNPATMGGQYDNRETATTAAIMDQRASIRIGMKSTNLEFIGFTEFYDMLLTLVNDFMSQETLDRILGELSQFYNPAREDRFKPVSQALETEASKNFKIQMWDQILGRVVGIPNPRTPIVVNYIIGQILEVMGGDFGHFAKYMFDENPRNNLLYQIAAGSGGGQQGMPGSTPNAGGGGAQNQVGLPQGMQEEQARQMMTMMGGGEI